MRCNIWYTINIDVLTKFIDFFYKLHINWLGLLSNGGTQAKQKAQEESIIAKLPKFKSFQSRIKEIQTLST